MITGRCALRLRLCLCALWIAIPCVLPAAPNPDYVNALWIAESDGVLKVSTATGTVLFQIPNVPHLRAAAVDEQRGVLWAYGKGLLRAYRFNGQALLAVPVPAPYEDDEPEDSDDATKHVALSVNSQNGSVWLGVKKKLHHYHTQGALLHSLDLADNIRALALDGARAEVWAATHKTLTAYDDHALPVRAIPFDKNAHLKDISFDGSLNELWVALKDNLHRYQTGTGSLVFQKPLPSLTRIASDGKGGLWVAADKSLLRLNSSGLVQLELQTFAGKENILALVADPGNLSTWAASKKSLVHISPQGQTLHSLEFKHKLHALALYTDLIPPVLSITAPPQGSYLNTKSPVLSFSYSDVGIGINPDSLTVTDHFLPLPVTCTHTPGASNEGASSCVPAGALAEGIHSLSATIQDYIGNVSRPVSLSFTVDTIPPVITVESPEDGASVTQGEITITGKISEYATLKLGDTAIALDTQHRFSHSVTLAAGENTFTFTATDRAGNTGSSTLHVSLQQNTTPDPAEVAPPVDPTVPTTLVSATEFLYTGNNPVQKNVAPGTIEPKRVAVLRGKVDTRDNAPLGGVKITLLNQPKYGYTETRSDGMFDLAVNGGGIVTVQYEKEGYLPVQRQVNAPWQDYAWMDDVVMIPVDPQVTAINLATQTTIEVAQGSPQTDADGTRQATLLFSPDTQATMTLPDGSTQALTSLHVRATEYTVGDNGPDAMPAPLPPASGYTYAVELSVDEALAAGAKTVSFSKPVYTYVENFLNFPTGTIVPAGYYDRDKAAWIPAPNGRVIKILSISNGLADLDTNGDNLSDSATQLAALSITEAERQKLASLYSSGLTLWRVPVTHFTPWDYNWPYGPPADAQAPQQPEAKTDDKLDDPTCESGSIIECENQILRERLPIVGTPYSLNYASDRVPGRKAAYTMTIPLSGATLPASLKRIELEISVAGRQFTHTYPAAPNQTHTFTWDGQDAYGRALAGRQPVTVRIGYVYQAVYHQPAQFAQSFAGLSGVPISGSRAREEITLWQQQQATLERWGASITGLGGWSLDIHHVYDVASKVLYQGNATRRSASGIGQAITTVAGTGVYGFSGDGGPASQSTLSFPEGVTLDAPGNLYIADSWNHRIRKVDANGVITTVAGSGGTGDGAGDYSGDGGPATQAELDSPRDVALDAQGNLYIADGRNSRIRKVDLGGVITTVAGNGSSRYSGDGGFATQAGLYAVSVAVDAQGNLYITDSWNYRIRKVDTSGVITTVAGNGSRGYRGDGGPATQAALKDPLDVAVDAQGNLYIVDTGNYRIRKVDTSGVITTVAGNGKWGFSGDGGPATRAELGYPSHMALDAQGNLYITDSWNYRIRKVDANGVITTVAGNGSPGFSGDGGPATQAELRHSRGMALDGQGNLYIADLQRIRKMAPALPGFDGGDFAIPSEDGGELYQFNAAGKHLRTLDALTKAVRYQFTYDGKGMLTVVTDGDGNQTVMERDGTGKPTAILAPDGQRTALTLDANNYLASVANPAGETTRMTYTPEGLLTRFTDGNGHASVMEYDDLGRLLKDTNAAGGFWTLARNDFQNGYLASLSSAFNRTTTYRVEDLTTGDKKRTNTAPDGTVTTTLKKSDGTTITTDSGGTVTTEVQGPDPRFGMQAPIVKSLTVTTPAGLTSTLTRQRTAVLTDNANPLSLTHLTDTVTMNGRTATQTYTAATRTLATVSPAGRQTQSLFDTQSRLLQQQLTGIEPIQYSYDTRGRLTNITQGTGAEARASSLIYNAQGYLATLTDALGRSQRYTYDAAGRVTQQTLPDGRAIAYTYDANGNLTSITPPSRPQHSFAYTPVNMEDTYTPPSLTPSPAPGEGATRYSYNLDKQLTTITRPDGQVVDLTYDSGGRLNQLTSGGVIPAPAGIQVTYGYHPTTGNVSQISTGAGAHLAYTYDGSLLLNETWSGPVSGTVSRAYDNDFRIKSFTAGGLTTVFTYDPDSLLIQAGDLSLTRDPQNGLLTGTALGEITTTQSYTPFGELSQFSASQGSNSVLNTTYTRDKLGRITNKTETVQGSSDTYVYSYDQAGRLIEVQQNGVTLSTYSYDANGNRLSKNSLSATYDAQDRLISYGANTYSYTANGELKSKTNGAQTTSYTYDVLGNLRAVTLPNGTHIEYVTDGRNRRIGKKVNGALVQGFLYQNQLNPIAELDSNGNVVARFVYGDKANVPAYMIKGGNTYRIISDHLGSPRLVVNTADGTVAQRMDYDEFGNITQDTNPGFQPFGFAGGLYDRDTQLTRFGARDYDAETGRWTAKDPIRFAGGDANLYSYVENNPLSYTDPSGLFIGSGLSRLLGRLLGRTPEEAAYGGKILDVGIGAAAGGVPDCIGGTDISTPRDLLRGFGGAQAIGLSTATTYGLYGAGATISSAGAATALPLFLAGYGGVEVGRSFNSLYEGYRGNSLGSDIYDLIN